MKKDQPTGDDVAAMLMNPYYVITLDEGLFGAHEPMTSEDEWVKANTRLIHELGPELYFRRFLRVLQGDYPRQPDQ